MVDFAKLNLYIYLKQKPYLCLYLPTIAQKQASEVVVMTVIMNRLTHHKRKIFIRSEHTMHIWYSLTPLKKE